MKYHNPFFRDVPIYGNLSVDCILIEDRYIILSVLKNEQNTFFLSLCCEIRSEQRWIIANITIDDLVSFLENKVDARALFLNESDKIVVVRNYKTRKETFCIVNNEKLDRDDLPSEDAFLDPTDGEFDDYLEQLKNREIIFYKTEIISTWNIDRYNFNIENKHLQEREYSEISSTTHITAIKQLIKSMEIKCLPLTMAK